MIISRREFFTPKGDLVQHFPYGLHFYNWFPLSIRLQNHKFLFLEKKVCHYFFLRGASKSQKYDISWSWSCSSLSQQSDYKLKWDFSFKLQGHFPTIRLIEGYTEMNCALWFNRKMYLTSCILQYHAILWYFHM